MTCPKCGYVSFPGLPQCKKCGHTLAQTPDSKAAFRPLSNPYEPISLAPPGPPKLSGPPNPSGPPQAPTLSSFAKSGSTGEGSLSRLHRPKSGEARETSLKFDFEAAGTEKREASDFLDQAFETGASKDPRSGIASVSLKSQHGSEPPIVLNRVSEGSAKVWPRSTQRADRQPNAFGQAEMPLVLDTTFMDSAGEAVSTELAAAPLRKRFLAGLIDAGILVLAGCLFAGLFVLVKGTLQTTPLNFAMAGFIAVFWIFVYFGSFTVAAFHTPGQAACGLTVANLDGERPTRQEAFLRAFGYLVSLAALMLGFLWAAMDSDGMAWHDHISGTILIESA